MKKQSIFITTIIITVIFLSIVQVVVSSSLSITGIDLSLIEKKGNVYKTENSILKEKLLYASSLSQIASKAATLGFVESSSIVVIRSSLPVAIKQ